jgi:hypothetical protein
MRCISLNEDGEEYIDPNKELDRVFDDKNNKLFLEWITENYKNMVLKIYILYQIKYKKVINFVLVLVEFMVF